MLTEDQIQERLKLLNNGGIKKYLKYKYQYYVMSNCYDFYDNLDSYYMNIEEYKKEFGKNSLEIAERITNAYYHRKSRLKQRIEAMLINGNCLFVTFTFTDNSLNTTTYDSRRRAVREYLKSYSDYYIANIDFGKLNHREHYHAILMTDFIDFKKWKYGSINARIIHHDNVSINTISKYINKLSKHALKKETGQSHRLIYGRKLKDISIK